jgi:ubiquinone/menaquinone biosynthesis C-methylase UbiE
VTVPWWKAYFGELYLRLFEATVRPERTIQEVAGTLEFLALPPRAHILDVACGQGRHAVPLARLGFRLAGLDLSNDLLRRAREAGASAGVEVQWVQGDMRHLPWREEFDACLSLYTALGYFEEEAQNQRVLEEVVRVLKVGGKFLVDVPNRDYYLLRMLPHSWRPHGEAVILEETTFDPATCRFTTSFTWVEAGQAETLTHSVRHYTAPEIEGMLQRAGMEPTARYGDFDGRPFDLDSSRLIVVARKS